MKTSRQLRLMVSIVGVLLIMATAVSVSSGAPASPGDPSVQTFCVDNQSATGPVTVNVPVTISGLGDLGAAAFVMFLEAPAAATFPSGSSAGSAFNAWCTSQPEGISRFFRTNIADDANCGEPHTAGTNCWQIDVFCLADSLSGGVMPTIEAQLAVNAPVGSHNLTIIPQLVNGSTTRVIDRNNDSAPMDPINNAAPTVVIGDSCGSTAVTMSGFDATTDSPAPFAAAAWPLLVGAAAVAAGGAYALLRRKS